MHPQANGRPLLRPRCSGRFDHGPWTARGLPWLLILVALAAQTASAQTADRIWGRVHTTGGQVHAGFIRWNRTAASWVDILEGSRELPEENYFAWLEAHDRPRATRNIEFRGHSITWNEVDPDFPMEVGSGVRFGHLDSLRVIEGERADLTLRSGIRLTLEPRGRDRVNAAPEVHVEVPGGTEVEVAWEELERVVFAAPPPGAHPAARRLHGTAEDRSGTRFTGHLAWDQDEILESDVLNGRETRRPNDRRVRFEAIRSLTRTSRGTRVELGTGRTFELHGSNDVGRGNRGLRVIAPGLGAVVVPWERLDAVRFHPATRAGAIRAGADGTWGARDGFDGGRLLAGVVTTRDGEAIRGRLRWDADEAGSWEFLDGEANGVRYRVEFTFIRRIEPAGEDGATVDLVDGRSLRLDGSRDVSPENKGVMVAPREDSEARGGPTWRLIPWDAIREVRFDPDSAPRDGREHR